VADPLFVDMESGNFKLKENSPAFKIGFKEFPLDNFGVTKSEFIKEANAAYLKYSPQLTSERNNKDEGRRYKWMGATIKT
uniref:hypothetical protein n=1 Tax=uncultured Sunxiuqinia sp. TaxID=1573825 RepID=UPI00261A927B